MTGIIGVCSRNGDIVDPGIGKRMLASLSHRGPGGTFLWHGRGAMIGELYSSWLPQEKARGSVSRGDADTPVIVLDGQLYNRAELVGRLGMSGEAEVLTDRDLILCAYERWGDACPAQLLGDLALAIWDPRRQSLFCARDHFGVRPFYYFCSNERMVFASEVRALWAVHEVPRSLDERELAHWLTYPGEVDRTVYRDIHRLPAAHTLRVTGDKVSRRRYWSLDPARELRLGSDAEYEEAYRQLFTEAVRCRLPNHDPIGAMLSGGLDSSSVTCVARDLLIEANRPPLQTFSAVYDDVPVSDERLYIDAVIDQGNVVPTYLHPDRLSPLTDWLGPLDAQNEPLWGPQLSIEWTAFTAARAKGIHVVLDGEGGDDVVTYGFGRITELLGAGHWVSAYKEVSALSQRYGLSKRYYLRWLGYSALVPSSIRTTVRRLRGITEDHDPIAMPMREDFVRRIGGDQHLRSLLKAPYQAGRTLRQDQWDGLNSVLIPFAFEYCSRFESAFGLEHRFPFFDRRFVEFCLALPSDQKLRDGWTRSIARRALAAQLPAPVRTRSMKATLAPAHVYTLRAHGMEDLNQLWVGDVPIAEYVDMKRLHQIYDRFSRSPRESDAFVLWTAANISRWLSRSGVV